MSTILQTSVLSVRHWTDRLFSFTVAREPSFRFISGQFAMIGLSVEGRPLLRAYSMVSPSHAESLEFLSIKVPDGPLTSRLQKIAPGETLLVNAKVSGTLVSSSLRPGRRLILISTGTGLAPFMSIVRDPETYERYEQVVLAHNCRTVDELVYRKYLCEELREDEWLGELARRQLLYVPIVSREPFVNSGRVTNWMTDGRLFAACGPRKPDDRFMVCGSPAMLKDLARIMSEWGLEEGSGSRPGDFVIERAFVDK